MKISYIFLCLKMGLLSSLPFFLYIFTVFWTKNQSLSSNYRNIIELPGTLSNKILPKKEDFELDRESFKNECVKRFPLLKVGKNIKLAQVIIEKTRSLDSRIPYLKYFQDYAHTLTYTCNHIERIGNRGDGGWFMCLDEGFMPGKSCLVYSFGVGSDWSFDDIISGAFNCRVQSFDPTLKLKDHVRKELINFRAIGLAHRDESREGKPYLTMDSIMTELNQSESTIDYLKVDIETWEWLALEQMVAQPFFAQQIKQLGVEFHLYGTPTYTLMKRVFEALSVRGFKLYKSRGNVGCKLTSIGVYVFYNCYELHFVNTRFAITS